MKAAVVREPGAADAALTSARRQRRPASAAAPDARETARAAAERRDARTAHEHELVVWVGHHAAVDPRGQRRQAGLCCRLQQVLHELLPRIVTRLALERALEHVQQQRAPARGAPREARDGRQPPRAERARDAPRGPSRGGAPPRCPACCRSWSSRASSTACAERTHTAGTSTPCFVERMPRAVKELQRSV